MMEYYLATKKHEFNDIHTDKSQNSIIQSARSQTQKTIHCMMPLGTFQKRKKTIATETVSVVARGQDRRMRMIAKGTREFWGMM